MQVTAQAAPKGPAHDAYMAELTSKISRQIQKPTNRAICTTAIPLQAAVACASEERSSHKASGQDQHHINDQCQREKREINDRHHKKMPRPTLTALRLKPTNAGQ